MTSINSDDRAVWWESGMEVDADGAPTAYHPDKGKGLDYLANAGHPGNWWGLVTNTEGDPVLQRETDPAPGYYISSTSLQDRSKAGVDPLRYVDSTAVPYASIPRNAIPDYGLQVGDVGFAYYRKNGRASAFVVGDTGPRNKWGEGSVKLAQNLEIPASAKDGGTDGGVVFLVFKGSSKGWPRTNEDVAAQVDQLLDAAGGFEQYLNPPQS